MVICELIFFINTSTHIVWCLNIINPLINVVNPANHNIPNNTDGVYSNINDDLTNTNTPAHTIVAACNNALTGVG